MGHKEYSDTLDEAALAYGEAAGETRSDIPPAPQADVRAEFKHIGGRTPRIDGRKIVTGAAPYTHDIKLRGMLIGKILRSPHAKAEIVSVDLSRAKALKGVKAVLKLAEDKVDFAGQQVAAVAAVDEKTAEAALRLIEVEYKPLPFVVNEDQAMAEGAPRVYAERPNVDRLREYERGDVEAGFKQADVVLERTYKTSVEIHHPTETHGSIAKWDGDRLTVWDSTQGVHSVRNALAVGALAFLDNNPCHCCTALPLDPERPYMPGSVRRKAGSVNKENALRILHTPRPHRKQELSSRFFF